jgi:UDP-N-acetylmuramyl tripeptide synthase
VPPSPFKNIDAFDLDWNPCFARSRRLTGMNRFFNGPAAILETRGPLALDADALLRWSQIAGTMVSDVWGDHDATLIRKHAAAAELVIRCPEDQLYTATEINEFAWEVAALGRGDAPSVDAFDRTYRFPDASHTRRYFAALAAAEREPALADLRAEAEKRDVPVVLDDDAVSLGAGHASICFPLSRVPRAAAVEWSALRRIPIALVTGSNGKTTTARLIAAMLDSANEQFAGRVGLCGTGGVVIGGEQVEQGDYSGPAGARTVLRHPRVAAAVLETARGGILRRGLAVERADVAVVTNISADHFGEYGIDTLDDIAEAKLTVARPLGNAGILVINADDPVLMRQAAGLTCKRALFSLLPESTMLGQHMAAGGLVCVARDGELVLEQNAWRASLGLIAEMPLAIGGAADYNVANLAAAALAAHAMQVPVDRVREVTHRFGADRADNPGRFERWDIDGFTVVMDYAHNPDGLARLLRVCQTLKREGGRLLLLLGQAGNREDADIRELARVAASFNPDRIVLKELPGFLRGRALGDVPALLRAALDTSGFEAAKLSFEADESAAAMQLVRSARPGDVVVLPVHQKAARDSLLSALNGAGSQ